MNKKERIVELVKLLNQACNAYYNLNKPIMEDKEYDKLYEELELLEKETDFILSDSPTQRAGFPVMSDLPKVKHDIPLLSLEKSKTIDKLCDFLGDKDGALMLKIDGATGKIECNKKDVIQFSTRGDSQTNIGEDITHNIKSIKNIPLKINDENTLQIVGENFITYENFNQINSKIQNKDDKFSHPRSLASASVLLLDSKICLNRHVQFGAFNIIKGNKFKTKIEQLEWLKEQGFDVIPYWLVNKNNIKEVIENIIDNLKNLPMPIDGLVLTYNDIEYGLSLKSTAHHPKHSISYKFEDEFYQTTYDHTEYNTTRLGEIVPVGIFNTVVIDGSKVSRASLCNVDIFESLQLGKGDIIETSKRNKIIPYIENNLTRSNTEKLIDKCPTCNGKVEIRIEKVARKLYCINPDCEAKFINKLKHFVSKQAMNIEGLSKATLEKFVDKNFINSFVDIFLIEQYKTQIINMDGFGEKSYNNLIDAIEKSKNVNLENFIYSLGIPKVGFSNAKKLCKFYENDINKILNCKIDELCIIDSFGDAISESIYNYFNNQNNIDLINELLKYIIINYVEVISNIDNNILNDKIFVITGDLNIYKRDELKQLIESLGGKVTDSVSNKTSYLINNDIKSTSSKNKKAKDLQSKGVEIKIITEQEFENMIK